MEEEKLRKIAAFEEMLSKYDKEDKIISSLEAYESLKDEKEPFTIKSGFPRLDELIGGFQCGELIIISGETKHGKTTLCQTLTENIAKQKINCLWFSYEMPKRQFLSKFSELPLFYLPRLLKSRSLGWIETRIWEAKIKANIKAVFIDHLHYLVDMEKLRNPSIEIGSIVRRLKRMAIKHNIVIFLICHTTKVASYQEPTYQDIRDSSFIAQESDGVFMIRRLDEPDRSRLTISIHRRTGIRKKAIILVYYNNHLYEEEAEAKKTQQALHALDGYKSNSKVAESSRIGGTEP